MVTNLLRGILGRLGYAVKKRRPGVKRSVSEGFEPVTPQNLMRSIHGKDIYEGFPFQDYPLDLQGWGSDSPAFAELVEAVSPELIIEVGSWKGGSAVTMADALQKQGKGRILCIDTWLGALEFWEDQTDDSRFRALECRHGYPQVYFRFLANVCHRGHQERIVPFPLHSASAALWLLRYGVRADLIYIDGSHEEEDVYQDLLDYFPLAKPGGLVFGDDWSWSGVRAAVERFASENRLTISHQHDKWILKR